MWERIPTNTEKLHSLGRFPLLPPVASDFPGGFVKNACKDLGTFELISKRWAKIVINQVRNKPPVRSSVKIPISEWPYHCLKYPLIGNPRILSVISGMAAPTDKASASRACGQRRTA